MDFFDPARPTGPLRQAVQKHGAGLSAAASAALTALFDTTDAAYADTAKALERMDEQIKQGPRHPTDMLRIGAGVWLDVLEGSRRIDAAVKVAEAAAGGPAPEADVKARRAAFDAAVRRETLGALALRAALYAGLPTAAAVKTLTPQQRALFEAHRAVEQPAAAEIAGDDSALTAEEEARHETILAAARDFLAREEQSPLAPLIRRAAAVLEAARARRAAPEAASRGAAARREVAVMAAQPHFGSTPSEIASRTPRRPSPPDPEPEPDPGPAPAPASPPTAGTVGLMGALLDAFLAGSTLTARLARQMALFATVVLILGAVEQPAAAPGAPVPLGAPGANNVTGTITLEQGQTVVFAMAAMNGTDVEPKAFQDKVEMFAENLKLLNGTLPESVGPFVEELRAIAAREEKSNLGPEKVYPKFMKDGAKLQTLKGPALALLNSARTEDYNSTGLQNDEIAKDALKTLQNLMTPDSSNVATNRGPARMWVFTWSTYGFADAWRADIVEGIRSIHMALMDEWNVMNFALFNVVATLLLKTMRNKSRMEGVEVVLLEVASATVLVSIQVMAPKVIAAVLMSYSTKFSKSIIENLGLMGINELARENFVDDAVLMGLLYLAQAIVTMPFAAIYPGYMRFGREFVDLYGLVGAKNSVGVAARGLLPKPLPSKK